MDCSSQNLQNSSGDVTSNVKAFICIKVQHRFIRSAQSDLCVLDTMPDGILNAITMMILPPPIIHRVSRMLGLEWELYYSTYFMVQQISTKSLIYERYMRFRHVLIAKHSQNSRQLTQHISNSSPNSLWQPQIDLRKCPLRQTTALPHTVPRAESGK